MAYLYHLQIARPQEGNTAMEQTKIALNGETPQARYGRLKAQGSGDDGTFARR